MVWKNSPTHWVEAPGASGLARHSRSEIPNILSVSFADERVTFPVFVAVKVYLMESPSSPFHPFLLESINSAFFAKVNEFFASGVVTSALQTDCASDSPQTRSPVLETRFVKEPESCVEITSTFTMSMNLPVDDRKRGPHVTVRFAASNVPLLLAEMNLRPSGRTSVVTTFEIARSLSFPGAVVMVYVIMSPIVALSFEFEEFTCAVLEVVRER